MPGLSMQYQEDGYSLLGEESIMRFWRANGQAIWRMQYDAGYSPDPRGGFTNDV